MTSIALQGNGALGLCRGGRQGEIPPPEDGARDKGQGRLDHVLELPNISRPGVFAEGGKGLGRERANSPLRTAVFLEEMLCEGLDVVGAIAQGRNLEAHHIQAVVEIHAETPRFDHPGEIAVGCRNDPDIDGKCAGRAHRSDFFVL